MRFIYRNGDFVVETDDGEEVTLPGQTSECNETVARMRREIHPPTRVEMAGPLVVRFVGGPRDGETMPLDRLPNRNEVNYLYPDGTLPPGRQLLPAPAPVTAEPSDDLYRVAHYRLRHPLRAGGEWFYVCESDRPMRPEPPPASIDSAWTDLGYTTDDGVRRHPTGWYRCASDHEEVVWEGTDKCWMCGEAGTPSWSPAVGDQAFAPYGWGGSEE